MKFIQILLLISLLSINHCLDSEYGFVSNKAMGNFELATEYESRKFHSYQAEGYVFFFGYSRCNTTCPMGLQTFHKLYENQSFPKTIIPIFISIDLARDNWENLNRLKKNYNDRIIFILPRSDEELRNLTKEFEVQFSRTNAMDVDYEINHTGNIYFVDKEFKLSRIFTSSHRDADKIANEIIKYYQGKKYEDER